MNTYKFKITDLRQGVKNPNRVNVFVDGKFSFSLDVSQVVDFHIKKGMEISAEQLEEYKNASEFGKLYQRTLEWVLLRPRSVRETRDYLYRKLKTSISETLGSARRYGRAGAHSLPVGRESSSIDVSEFPAKKSGCPSEDIPELPYKSESSSIDVSEFPAKKSGCPLEDIPELSRQRERVRENLQEISSEIISRLISKGYLDDRKFAEWYVENRFVKKGISQKRLAMELMKKGIAREIIDEVLGSRNDEEEILKIIAKKRTKYTEEKLIAYLCRQGFPYQLVQDLVRTYEMD